MNAIVLAYGFLDSDHLSSTEGYLDSSSNVLICLYKEHREFIENWETQIDSLVTHSYDQHYQYDYYPTLDNFMISSNWEGSHFAIIGSYASTAGFHVLYNLVDETCVLQEDSKDYCSISVVDREIYHTGTTVNQLVLSEYEELDNGIGFGGLVEYFLESDSPKGSLQSLDYPNSLSNTPVQQEAYWIPEWIFHYLNPLS